MSRRKVGCCGSLVSGGLDTIDIGGLRYAAGGRVARDCNDSNE